MKRASYVVVTLLVIFCLLSVVPFEADAAGAMTLAQLQEKFPNGSYWNHYVSNVSQAGDSLGQRGDESFADTVTSSPCASHSSTDPYYYVGKYDCNYFDGGWQCFGFARKLGYDAFGTKVRLGLYILLLQILNPAMLFVFGVLIQTKQMDILCL